MVLCLFNSLDNGIKSFPAILKYRNRLFFVSKDLLLLSNNFMILILLRSFFVAKDILTLQINKLI